jgi:hypothetical protein
VFYLLYDAFLSETDRAVTQLWGVTSSLQRRVYHLFLEMPSVSVQEKITQNPAVIRSNE